GSRQIQWIRHYPIRHLASLEPKEKPRPVMFTFEQEDESQSVKSQHQNLEDPNDEQLRE
ncbi:hypothetical protein KI387_004934, partial [Taxus chinensis]